MVGKVNIGPETLLTKLPGVGEVTAKRLARLGLQTVRDLWEYPPFRYEDYSRLTTIKDLFFDQEAVIRGQIERTSWRQTKKGVLLIQAVVKDQSGKIAAIWFNQRYLLKMLTLGSTITIYGVKKLLPTLGNPFLVKRIVTQLGVAPIYRTTDGLTQPLFRRLIRSVLPALEQTAERLPAKLIKESPTYRQAIDLIHTSSSGLDQDQARERLALEELVILNLKSLAARADRAAMRGLSIAFDETLTQKFVSSLPFRLTNDQRRAAWEIINDLVAGSPMNRLLYGEVGSGKTAVALIAALTVLQAGYQVVWLSPTVVLASQLSEVAGQLLEPFGFSPALMIAGRQPKSALFTVGTQAVFQRLKDLQQVGLIIVDEQHRFGVEQRQLILKQQPQANLLMMSATPIPRSLAQTIFGHLDISYIIQKPAIQQPVETILFDELNRPAIERQIEMKLAVHEPGYVICPLIEAQTEDLPTLFGLDNKTVVEEEKRLRQVFPQARLITLHGRLKSREKERIIQEFRSGKYDILLSTTVVEVGIDNPAASWILIEQAEMFGLATLHQLRGRVGRGGKRSTCFLSVPKEPTARQRLEIVAETTNGLEIAEADLTLRGPGELLGEAQSGLANLKFLKLTNRELFARGSRIAKMIFEAGIEKYPELARVVKHEQAVHAA